MLLIIPNFAVRIAQGMCFRKRYGFSIRKCTGIGKNNAWNHPYHPSRYPRNLIQCHLLRAHSPRIYIRSLPNFLCPYLRACAFGKWWGGPLRKSTLGGQKSTSNHHKDSFLRTRLKFTFQRSFLHEYASDHSQLCCAYSSGHVFSKKVWVLDSKMYGYRQE